MRMRMQDAGCRRNDGNGDGDGDGGYGVDRWMGAGIWHGMRLYRRNVHNESEVSG